MPMLIILFGLAPPSPEMLETPAGRLKFMKESLATHELHPDDDPAMTYRLLPEPVIRFRNTLGLLPKPFARYGKPGTGVVDGALFAYVLTTDPDVYLMIEARAGQGGPEWQYAFAPASVWALKGSWKGEEVWSLPYREAWTDR